MAEKLGLNFYSREAYGMQFFDDNSGITVGRDGAIYKTQNGGSSWQWISAMPTFTYDSGYDLRSLYFFDPQNGICVGDNGRIIKTENGGANWKNYSPTYDEINEFHLVTPNKGFMKTNKGEFFKMDTNENTLVKLQSPPNQNTQAFFFVNESVGYSIGANQGSVYKTTDGGTNWNLTNNSTNIILYESLYSISFLNENLGYVSGGYNQPGVFRTTNGGVSWEKISNYSFIYLKFVDQNVGFGMRAGMNSILYKTTDGGVTWSPCFNNSSWQIIFYALDKDNIFIKSDEGDSSFHKTTDGGSSWVQSNILDYGFDKIKFINNNVGFVADNSRIYTTPDAGQTWNLVFYNDDFYDIKSMDIFGDQLFITGNGGRILRLSVAYLSANQTNFKKNEATLYPNPAMNILNVTSCKKISEINIVNTLGTTISKHAQKGNIDISKLNTGVYFVEIIFSDKTKQVSKIIKE